MAEGLTPLRRRIFELVFLDRRSHIEAYELIRSQDAADLSFRAFLVELRATYKAVTEGRRGFLMRTVAVPIQATGNEAPATATEDAPGDEAERQGRLEQALGTLSAEDRVAVELYVLEELPAADIARMLALPNAKTVYNRVYRALEALRSHLEQAGIRREDL